jgi:hypothetical protein
MNDKSPHTIVSNCFDVAVVSKAVSNLLANKELADMVQALGVQQEANDLINAAARLQCKLQLISDKAISSLN